MGVGEMIDECLNELQILDALRDNQPLSHEQAYASYEISHSEDPRVWFEDMR
jgi:hypothetical protein